MLRVGHQILKLLAHLKAFLHLICKTIDIRIKYLLHRTLHFNKRFITNKLLPFLSNDDEALFDMLDGLLAEALAVGAEDIVGDVADIDDVE